MRERVGGQLAKQCMQLPAGVGASRRRHPPGSRQGGPAVPKAFLVRLGPREGVPFDLICYTLRHYTGRVPKYTSAVHHG